MKKELVFAIVIGVLVGLLVVVGIYQARRAVLVEEPGPNPSPTASGEPTTSSVITLTSPAANVLQTTRGVQVAGNSNLPDQVIVIFVNEVPYFGRTDAHGSFNQSVTLDEGANFIQVRIIKPDGKTEQTERAVVYLSSIPEASAAAEIAPSPAAKKAATSAAAPKASPKP